MSEENKELLIKAWKKWLIDIDKSATQVAKEEQQTQQNLNQKINNGTIRAVELQDILNHQGYMLKIVKKEGD